MRLIDLTGRRFGRLTVLGRDASGRNRGSRWTCRCDCGTEVVASSVHLRSGSARCRTACVLSEGRTPWPGDPRYLVGEDGSIVGPQGRIRSTSTDPCGYPRVTIGCRSMPVHTIVCETFHGPRPTGMEVAHKNGKPADCRASNLRWATPVENNADKIRHGTDTPGERNSQHKLTESDIRAIRNSNASETTLAVQYGVSRSNIGMIVRRRTWAHVS